MTTANLAIYHKCIVLLQCQFVTFASGRKSHDESWYKSLAILTYPTAKGLAQGIIRTLTEENYFRYLLDAARKVPDNKFNPELNRIAYRELF
jgi:hypothetical protein